MSKTNVNDTSIDTSIDTIISNQINSYLFPKYSIFKIKYLYSESYEQEFIDKDGATCDFDHILTQKIVEKFFEIIPDDNLDEKSKKIVINMVNKNICSCKFTFSIFKYYKIPESLFVNWIKNINLFKKKTHSFIYLSHQRFYSSNKIFNCVKENKSIQENIFDCILKNNYLESKNKSFCRIK